MVQLDGSKAAARLGWRPLLPLETALEATARWYRQVAGGGDARRISAALLEEYCAQVEARDGAPRLAGTPA